MFGNTLTQAIGSAAYSGKAHQLGDFTYAWSSAGVDEIVFACGSLPQTVSALTLLAHRQGGEQSDHYQLSEFAVAASPGAVLAEFQPLSF